MANSAEGEGVNNTDPDEDYEVTVCDACLRASCWHYVFPCDKVSTAGTRRILASTLRALALEHETHYTRRRVAEIEGR